jgi:hypothetical protein
MMELPKRRATSLYGQPAHSARIGLLGTSAVRQRGLGDGKGAAAGGVATLAMYGGGRAARLGRPSLTRPARAPRWQLPCRAAGRTRHHGAPTVAASGAATAARSVAAAGFGRGTIPRVSGRRRPH